MSLVNTFNTVTYYKKYKFIKLKTSSELVSVGLEAFNYIK